MQCPCKVEEGQFVDCNGLSELGNLTCLLHSFLSLESLQIKMTFVCFPEKNPALIILGNYCNNPTFMQ